MIILSTVYFLITRITNQNTLIGDIITGWLKGATGQAPNESIPEIANWFLTNYAYLTLFLVPVFSFASYLSFFKFRKTYLEHVVINSYITGQQAIIYSFFAIIGTFLRSEVIEVFPIIMAISYTFWVFWYFFRNGNRMMNLLRSTMTYILYSIFSLGLLALLV